MGRAKADVGQKKMETGGNQEQYFKYTCSAEHLYNIKKGFAVLVSLMTVFFILTGTYSCQSMGDIAVLLSWFVYLVPLLLAWNGLFRLLRQKETVTFRERKRGPERLQQSGGIAALIAGASMFACIYFLVTGEYESIAVEIGMVIRTAAEFLSALGLGLLGRFSLSNMEEIPEQEKEQTKQQL